MYDRMDWYSVILQGSTPVTEVWIHAEFAETPGSEEAESV
jgi:hypothetical protein